MIGIARGLGRLQARDCGTPKGRSDFVAGLMLLSLIFDLLPRRAVLVALMVSVPALAAAQTLEWTAGAPGGGWFAVASGLARVLAEGNSGFQVNVIAGGSLDNPPRIQSGTSQLGMAVDFLAASAARGEAPFGGNPHTKLRSLGTGWYPPSVMHLLGPAGGEGGLAEAVAAPGLTIGTTPKGTSEELTLRRILAFYGSSVETIEARGGRVVTVSFADLVGAFAEGKIGYVFGAAALPAEWVTQIARGRRPARLVALPPDLVRHLAAGLGYRDAAIPVGTYPGLHAGAVPVAAIDTVILISAEVPEDVAYRVTRTLLKARGRFGAIHAGLAAFDPAKAWRDQPVPLHPGAERAYREGGFM